MNKVGEGVGKTCVRPVLNFPSCWADIEIASLIRQDTGAKVLPDMATTSRTLSVLVVSV